MRPVALCMAVWGALVSGAAAADDPAIAPDPDDRLGRVGRLGPENVKNALSLVTTGKIYSLAVVTSSDTPAFGDREYAIEIRRTDPEPLGANAVTALDDRLIADIGVGTQIDGFGHIGVNDVHYNGVPRTDFMTKDGISVFGTHLIPPIVTRGVLLDIATLKGVARMAAGDVITPDDIRAAMAAQQVEIRTGDVVLLHTGWMQMIDEDPVAFANTEPGLGVAAAQYLADLGVVAVGADTSALEVIPFEQPDRFFEVHQILLAKNGVHILEFIRTDALAADRAYEFAFILAVPRFYGAVQMVSHPIAIR